MEKFKVGDIVAHKTGIAHSGRILKILGNKKYEVEWLDRKDLGVCKDPEEDLKLILKREPMSKYAELKQRIEAINQNTTVKEWDDVLGEIGKKYTIRIPCGSDGEIIIYKRTKHSCDYEVLLSFTDQCSKGEAIKDAMLWLLDHSDLKDEKAEKIAELKKEMEILAGKIKEIEND